MGYCDCGRSGIGIWQRSSFGAFYCMHAETTLIDRWWPRGSPWSAISKLSFATSTIYLHLLVLVQYLMLMSSAAEAFMRPYLTRTCRVCLWIRWLRFDHVLWQRVPTITDSDTEECFPDGFGTSWDVNFYRMSSEIVYFWSHLEKQLAINTFLPCQDLIRFN